jgi:L-rhamnose-H+ transport protein
MSSSAFLGFALILLAAAMNGAYAIPMRFMPAWKWENIWFVWTLLSLWILPLVMVVLFVPHPFAAFDGTTMSTVMRMAVLGILWGAGVLLLGLSFPLVGVSVGAAVGLGCAAAAGTVLPILAGNAPTPPTATAVLIAIGVVAVLVGVAICGYAGRLREKQQGSGTMILGHSLRGLALAVVGGSLTSTLNLALASGGSISASLQAQHPASSLASILVWIPVLIAGGLPGLVYTAALLWKRQGSSNFVAAQTAFYWPLVAFMACLWLGSIVVYGNGVGMIGLLGVVIGWPVFMSGAVIASAGWGAAFGEWRGANFRAKASMGVGVIVLMAAISVLSRAGH